jgi:mediator of RNA polymerase II transcription subunit 25
MEPPPDILAVALVVESSIAVAAEWPLIILNYVTNIVKRLGDANPGYRVRNLNRLLVVILNITFQLRIGFVTYATASTFPSPVLCKRFFTEYPAVMREMREDPAKLGIGQTNSGGTRGMAALEGLVAAIEVRSDGYFLVCRPKAFSQLFDILHISAQPARQHVNHIFHVAASTPDTSIHPQWNDSPSLDSVTWEDLPAELKAVCLTKYLY